MYQVVDDADPVNPVGEYIEHRNALINNETQRRSLDAAAKFSRDVRLRFLKMNLQERELFLQVLTSDENEEFRTLFTLQSELVSGGVDDERIADAARVAPTLNRRALTQPNQKLIDAVRVAHVAQARQQFKRGRRAKSRALPGHNPLTLPGGSSNE